MPLNSKWFQSFLTVTIIVITGFSASAQECPADDLQCNLIYLGKLRDSYLNQIRDYINKLKAEAGNADQMQDRIAELEREVERLKAQQKLSRNIWRWHEINDANNITLEVIHGIDSSPKLFEMELDFGSSPPQEVAHGLDIDPSVEVAFQFPFTHMSREMIHMRDIPQNE